MAKTKAPPRTEEKIRELVHRYFHDRYNKGRGERGKNGIAAKISVIRQQLKASHGLTQQEVARALTYLIDEGWVRREEEQKMYQTPGGTMRPATAVFYRITSPGVTKIEGDSEYTMPKFQGININATGQNIITLGDNNQIDARYESIGKKLIEFKQAVSNAVDIEESAKLSIVADVNSMQSQLAKPEPNRTVLRALWAGIEKMTVATSLAANVAALAPVLQPLIG